KTFEVFEFCHLRSILCHVPGLPRSRDNQAMECICPILGRPTEVEPTAYSRGSWKIMRCRETGFVFLQDPPDYSRLEQEFAWEHTLGAERDRRAREEPIVHEMSTAAKTLKGILAPKRNKILSLVRVVLREKHPIRPLRVLDVGCATGDLLVKIHSQSTGHEIELHGIEVSNELHAICAERLASIGGVAHLGNAFDRTADFAAGSLDVVIMSSFLEHEAQPLELLRRVHSILSDDGAVVLKVPNLACLN